MGRVWSGGIIIEINVLAENANVFLSRAVGRRWRRWPILFHSHSTLLSRTIFFIVAIGGAVDGMIRTNGIARAALLQVRASRILTQLAPVAAHVGKIREEVLYAVLHERFFFELIYHAEFIRKEACIIWLFVRYKFSSCFFLRFFFVFRFLSVVVLVCVLVSVDF